MERIQIIKTILELDNFFLIEFSKRHKGIDLAERLWNMQLLELKPDRFYLVESLKEASWDRENDTKTYKPETEVRYLLRSGEAAKYGKYHEAFYKRYLRTISIENEYIENPQAYKDKLIKDMDETYNKKEKSES